MSLYYQEDTEPQIFPSHFSEGEFDAEDDPNYIVIKNPIKYKDETEDKRISIFIYFYVVLAWRKNV